MYVQQLNTMASLFQESDFALFTQYQGKTQAEAPDGFAPMRQMYNKLGNILDGLQRLGYHTNIRRNPLAQAGPATLKYCDYHWAKVYPKEHTLFKECEEKIFFVIGTAQDGFNIHIDTNSKKGIDSENNKEAKTIKNNTWWQFSPKESSQKSLEEFVSDTDKYIHEYWIEFNKFASIYGVQESIKILKNMELDRIKKLLLGNHNLILTGAPGTGKTYLAKQLAKAIGATDESINLVQFHPSYDYTDFVEGLRPVGEKKELGFERKDGVFKAFCKKAVTAQSGRSFEALYKALTKDITDGIITKYETLSGKEYELKVEDGTIKFRCLENGTKWRSENTDNIKLLFEFLCKDTDPSIYYNTEKIRNLMEVVSDGTVKTVDPSEYIWTIKQLIYRYKVIPAIYVFIIDEINRGEISKIFGELFYSIDAGYRGTKGRVNTQYQNLVPRDDLFAEGFYIPENVYILGTMNDIDRSVESMDFAMRRRFAWKEITAESRQSMLDEDDAWGDNPKPSPDIIAEMKIRMNNLNACIIDKYLNETLSSKDKIGLTKAYQIGASYFLKYATYGNFDELWENHIEGLLYEYLRGSSNVETKIEKLHQAYNDITSH